MHFIQLRTQGAAFVVPAMFQKLVFTDHVENKLGL